MNAPADLTAAGLASHDLSSAGPIANEPTAHGVSGHDLKTIEPASIDINSLAQAAEWFAILRDESVSDAERAQWQVWLAAHPQHRAAWSEVQAVSSPFSQISLVGDPHAAKAALSKSSHTPAMLSRRRALKLLGAGSIALLTGTLVHRHSPWRDWVTTLAARTDSYHTPVGSTQMVTLAEGSQLWLNTGSHADVAYSLVLRRITLRGGELLLQSAKDSHHPARPLVADTKHGRLTALGTRFTVRLEGDSTFVAVYEGTVAIRPIQGLSGQGLSDPGLSSLVLQAGQQTRFTAHQVSPAQAADQARESWTRGILLADNRRLDDFIAELATYRRGKLSVASQVAGLRLMGAYPLRDTDRVLAAITDTLPVRLRHVSLTEAELVKR